MCGRYFLTAPGEVLADLFELPPEAVADCRQLAPRYNIAPTQQVPIVRQTADGPRELAMVRWGLIPHWAKEKAIGNKLINARGETLAEKPTFRDAFKRRRCLIPASGFYEWKKQGATKQPYVLRLRSGEPFALAGLWSSWSDPEIGLPLETCTIITTTPNEVASIVHDRMPVILDRTKYALWLDSGEPASSFTELFHPYPASEMEAFPVSRRVNSPAIDAPENIEPIA